MNEVWPIIFKRKKEKREAMAIPDISFDMKLNKPN